MTPNIASARLQPEALLRVFDTFGNHHDPRIVPQSDQSLDHAFVGDVVADSVDDGLVDFQYVESESSRQ